MHFLQANIGMGLDHQGSLNKGLQSIGAFFLTRDPDFFRKNAEIQTYINYIDRENPDVLYLTEVCGIEQCEMLDNALNQLGYKMHIIKGFELWNMQDESHKYLYHIMGSRIEFKHHQTIQQYTSNNVIKFLKRNKGLGKGDPIIANQVASILDGGGSRYSIGDIEVGFLHAHAIDSTHVFQGLMHGLATSNNMSQVMIGDMNMKTDWSEKLARENNPNMKRIQTNRTYPHYFNSIPNSGILTRTIQNSMISKFLPYPDQAFINPIGINVIKTSNFGPKQTGLKTDHSVNHFHLEVK